MRKIRRYPMVIVGAGRALAVYLPLFATGWFGGVIDPVWTVVIGAVWIFAIQVGFTASETELYALGSAVAATRGTALGVLLVSAVLFWVDGVGIGIDRLLVCGLVVLVLLLLWETTLARVLPRRRDVLIVGSNSIGVDIASELCALGHPSFKLLGYVTNGPVSSQGPCAPVVGQLDDLADCIRRLRPEIVVIATNKDRPAVFGTLIENADVGFRIVEAAQFCEYAFGRVPVRNITRAWFMSVLHLYQQPYSRISRRIFDVVLATLGLIFTAPLLVAVTAAVWISGRPVLLRQTRVGENGKLFTMLKFRTMRPDAEQPGEAIWATRGDPRITSVGRVLRRTRIDELPQLWNVIRGDMSIVGPRPERPEFVSLLEERVPHWTRRELVKPGVTGWAQVRSGYASAIDESIDKLSYDLWYLRHRSIFVDVAICLLTLRVIIFGSPTELSSFETEWASPPAIETESASTVGAEATPAVLSRNA